MNHEGGLKTNGAASGLPGAFQSLLELSPVPMAELEGDRHLVRYANPALCRLLGKSSEAVAGGTFAEALRVNESCLAVLDRVYQTGEPATHTDRENPGGRGAYWSYVMWPILDPGRPAGVIVQVIEPTLLDARAGAMNEALLISSVYQHEQTESAQKLNDRLHTELAERRRIEEALRQSETRLAKELTAMQSLQQVSTLLSREGNLEALYPPIVDAAVALMSSDAASIQMLDDNGSRLRLLAWRGFHPDAAKYWQRVGLESKSASASALRSQRRVVVPDVETCESMAETEDLKSYRLSGIRAVQSTPLVSRTGRLLGTISTHWRRPGQPSEEDLQLFNVLARQTADLIERARWDAAQTEADARLQRAYEFDQATMASMSEGLYTINREGLLTSMNPAAEALFGWRFGELSGRNVHERTHHHHPDHTRFPAGECPLLRVFQTGEPVTGQEDEFIRRDGNFFPVTYSAAPVREGAEIAGLVVVFRDITERKRAQERERTLANEIAHRNKNLLAIIQTIVSRSLAEKRTPAEARESIMQRLQAIGKSQTAIEIGGSVGASLDEITRLEFEAFSGRIEAAGPEVLLNPRAAQTFSMLLHELATNAMKYGSLSSPGGRVSVEWFVEGRDADAQFRFCWIERGGPAVAPRTRQGFGSVMIEKVVAQDFGAQATVDFAPEGLRYEIDVSLSSLVPEGVKA